MNFICLVVVLCASATALAQEAGYRFRPAGEASALSLTPVTYGLIQALGTQSESVRPAKLRQILRRQVSLTEDQVLHEIAQLNERAQTQFGRAVILRDATGLRLLVGRGGGEDLTLNEVGLTHKQNLFLDAVGADTATYTELTAKMDGASADGSLRVRDMVTAINDRAVDEIGRPLLGLVRPRSVRRLAAWTEPALPSPTLLKTERGDLHLTSLARRVFEALDLAQLSFPARLDLETTDMVEFGLSSENLRAGLTEINAQFAKLYGSPLVGRLRVFLKTRAREFAYRGDRMVEFPVPPETLAGSRARWAACASKLEIAAAKARGTNWNLL